MEGGGTNEGEQDPQRRSLLVRERVAYRVGVALEFADAEAATLVRRRRGEVIVALRDCVSVVDHRLSPDSLELAIELDGDPVADGCRQAADEAARLVKVAVSRCGLAPAVDAGRLRIVGREVAPAPPADAGPAPTTPAGG